MEHQYGLTVPQFSKDYQKLPVSPQTYTSTRPSNDVSPKFAIFTPVAKPRDTLDSPWMDTQTMTTTETSIDFGYEPDLRRSFAQEMKRQLENLKKEFIETTSALAKDYIERTNLPEREIQEIKKQDQMNMQKYAELQANIGQVESQRYKINSQSNKGFNSHQTSKMLLSPKSSLGKSQITGNFSFDVSNTSKKMEFEAQTLKEKIAYAKQVQEKLRQNQEEAIKEARQTQQALESKLLQNFGSFNVKLKRMEESVEEFARRKNGGIEAIAENFTASLNHQGVVLNEEIKLLGNLVRSKCDASKVKSIIIEEITEKLNPLVSAKDYLKTVEETMSRKIQDLNPQFEQRINNLKMGANRSKSVGCDNHKYDKDESLRKELARKENLQRLSQDIRGYQQNLHQLKEQLREVSQIHNTMKSRALTPESQSILTRINQKMQMLQVQVEEVEGCLRVSIANKMKENRRRNLKNSGEKKHQAQISSLHLDLEREDLAQEKIRNEKVFKMINAFIKARKKTSANNEDEICCYFDDEGHLFDDENNYLIDERGFKVRLSETQIQEFNGCFLEENSFTLS